jgi:hypothetical protein
LQPARRFVTGAIPCRILNSANSHAAKINHADVLYSENLPPAFFDLSSGVAGAILQKLRNYKIRLAGRAKDFSRPIPLENG